MENSKVFGVTSPLITNSDGTKFGKSEGKNIWLDAEKTSPYHFYQYWMNVSDADVIDFLKRLSFLTKPEIEALEEKVKTQAHLREAQTALATELTELVHGKDGLESAQKITSVFFNGAWDSLSESELSIALSDAPSLNLEGKVLLIDALVEGKICSSKREAREMITGGSITVNGSKVQSLEFELESKDAFFNRYTVIRKGKKTYFVVKFEG